MTAIYQILEMLHKCVSDFNENHQLEDPASLCTMILLELQNALKAAVKLHNDHPKKARIWKESYLQALKLEGSSESLGCNLVALLHHITTTASSSDGN